MKKGLSLIRWKYVIPLAIFTAALFVFFFFFFDPILARTIEKYASKANGAKVDVSGLKTKILSGRLSIQRLQVADKENVMKNSVEAGPLVFQIDLSELFSKHLIIPEANLDGLRFGTDRKTSGALPKPLIELKSKSDEKPSAVEKLTEKYKDQFKLNLDGLKNQAKDKIKFDPKDLALYKEADKIKAKADALPAEWKSKVDSLNFDGRLKKLEADISEIQKTKLDGPEAIATIPQSLKKLQAVKDELNKMKSEVKSTKDGLGQELKGLKDNVSGLKDAKKQDMDELLSRFNLDFANPKRIVESLIGPSVMSKIRMGLHYAQLAQKHMPSKKDKDLIPPKPRGKGINIEFPTPAALPRFWLGHASLSGEYEALTAKGQLSNLTTNPPRIGKPFIMNLDAQSGAHQFLAKAIIDHVTEVKRSSYSIEGKNLQIKEIITQGVFGEALNEGTGNALVKFFTHDENGIQGVVQFDMSHLKLDDAPLLKSVGIDSVQNLSREDQIKAKFMTNIARAIEKMPAVSVTGNLTGTWDDPNISFTSNLTDEITKVVKSSIGDVVNDQKKELEGQLDQVLNSKKGEIDQKLGGLQSKLDELLGGFDTKIQDKVNQSTGLNLTPKDGAKGIVPNLKIPSLDKLFKK